MSQKSIHQFFPFILTLVTTGVLCILLYFFLSLLNLFPLKGHIQLTFHPGDIVVGMIIYLKTSIDFAILIGNLMQKNTGWKKRIAIELGTACGNALGTLVILTIWFFFKEAPILMIIMIFLASLVLLKMAEEGFSEFLKQKQFFSLTKPLTLIQKSLYKFNRIFTPLIARILPRTGITTTTNLPFLQLLFLACTIPFILGLDDFAGYIPLFSLVNVFSFCLGIFLAHMLLNLALFAFPKKTTSIVSYPLIIVFGSFAFVAIALWGFIEAMQLLLHLL